MLPIDGQRSCWPLSTNGLRHLSQMKRDKTSDTRHRSAVVKLVDRTYSSQFNHKSNHALQTILIVISFSAVIYELFKVSSATDTLISSRTGPHKRRASSRGQRNHSDYATSPSDRIVQRSNVTSSSWSAPQAHPMYYAFDKLSLQDNIRTLSPLDDASPNNRNQSWAETSIQNQQPGLQDANFIREQRVNQRRTKTSKRNKNQQQRLADYNGESRRNDTDTETEANIGEDIETVNALIGVLTETNKRLIEQRSKLNRDKQNNEHEKSDFNVVTPIRGSKNKTLELDSRNETHGPARRFDESFPLALASSRESIRAYSAPNSTASGGGSTFIERPVESIRKHQQEAMRLPVKKRKKSVSAKASVKTKTGQLRNDTSPLGLRRIDLDHFKLQQANYSNQTLGRLDGSDLQKTTKAKKSSGTTKANDDHVLVKPGSDDLPDDGSFGLPGRSDLAQDKHQMGRRNVPTLLRNGGHQTAQQQQQQPMILMDPTGGISPAEYESTPASMLQGHRPMSAQDLLHVRPQQQRRQHHQPTTNQQNDRGAEHNPMFGPYQQDQQQQNELSAGGPLYESHLPYGPPGSAINLHRPLIYPAYPVQDQYQAHQPSGISSPLGQNQHSNDDPDELGGGQQRDRSEANEGHARLGHQHPLDRALPHEPQPSPQHQTPGSPNVQQHYAGHPLLGPLLSGYPSPGLNNRFGELTTNEPHTGHPLQHLLEAARNQQAAALSYERRRLNYEQELRKREEGMRRQHEANLERQRQAAQQRAAAEAAAAAAAAAANRQQSENSNNTDNNNNSGSNNSSSNSNNNNADDNGQQKEQAQQNEQENGDQNKDSEQQGNNQNDSNNNNNNNNNSQEQQSNDDDESLGNQQQQTNDDPDMKGFQSFGANTDFTDLFPPGILSKADIEDMRRQQQEQQRQDQENQDERENGPGEQQQSQPNEQESDEQQQQQQQQQQHVDTNADVNQQQSNNATSSSSGTAVKQPEIKQEEGTKNASLKPEVVVKEEPVKLAPEKAGKNSSGASLLPNNLPIYMFKNVSDQSAKKTRRSHSDQPRASQLTPQQSLLVLGSEYHDRYVKPFLFTITEAALKRSPSLSSGKQNELQQPKRTQITPTTESSARQEEDTESKAITTTGDNWGESHEVPLVEFDDLLDDDGQTLNFS